MQTGTGSKLSCPAGQQASFLNAPRAAKTLVRGARTAFCLEISLLGEILPLGTPVVLTIYGNDERCKTRLAGLTGYDCDVRIVDDYSCMGDP